MLTQAAGGEPQSPRRRPEPGDGVRLLLRPAGVRRRAAPRPGRAAPSCAVGLRFDCHVQGVGVDPPTRRWSGRRGTATAGSACEVDSDGTGGLNRPGDVVLHVPRSHAASVIGRQRAGWLRCRVVPADRGLAVLQRQPHRSPPPSAFTVGGTVAGRARRDRDRRGPRPVRGRARASCSGSPAGRWSRTGEPFEVEVAAGARLGAWQRGRLLRRLRRRQTGTSASTGRPARSASARRSASPTARCASTARCRPRARRSGCRLPRRRRAARQRGGRRDPGAALDVPFVDRVENRRGGASAASTPRPSTRPKLRGPLALRTRDRAVTAEDYEQLAREAAPEVARVRAVPARSDDEAGGVRVLVVPGRVGRRRGPAAVRGPGARPPRRSRRSPTTSRSGARSAPGWSSSRRTTRASRSSRSSSRRPRAASEELQRDAVLALYRYFNPLTGGPDGTGWPFGRPVQAGEVYAVLQRLPGTELVEEVRAVRRRPGHRRARRARAADRPRPVRADLLLRPPDPGDPRWLSELVARHGAPASPRRRRCCTGCPACCRTTTFTQRFVRAFDEAYAPILTTLDSLACYFDPRLAPPDFVDYLAGWVGRRARRLVDPGAAARDRGRRRARAPPARHPARHRGGAAPGARRRGDGHRHRRLHLVARRPAATCPAPHPPRMEVRIEVDDPDAVDPRRVESLLDATKPAHVRTASPSPGPPEARRASRTPARGARSRPPSTPRRRRHRRAPPTRSPPGRRVVTRTCPDCGVALEADEQFCGNCGCYLDWTDQPEPEHRAELPATETDPAAAPGLVERVRIGARRGRRRPDLRRPATAVDVAAATPAADRRRPRPRRRPRREAARPPPAGRGAGTGAGRARAASHSSRPHPPRRPAAGRRAARADPARATCLRQLRHRQQADPEVLPSLRRRPSPRLWSRGCPGGGGCSARSGRSGCRRGRQPPEGGHGAAVPDGGWSPSSGVLAVLGVGTYCPARPARSTASTSSATASRESSAVPDEDDRLQLASRATARGMAKDGTPNKYWAPASARRRARGVRRGGFSDPVRLVYVLITPGVSASDEEAVLRQGRPSELRRRGHQRGRRASDKTVELEDKRGPVEVSLQRERRRRTSGSRSGRRSRAPS